MSLRLETVSYLPSPQYPGLNGLSELSLEIAEGELVGLMGVPGSGKSSLLALMAGLVRPERGSVYLNGTDIGKKNKKGGTVPPRPALLTHNSRLSLYESSLERELSSSLRDSGLSREERARRVRHWLDRLGFAGEEYAGLSPLCLSDGEKQRLALAAVMVREAPVLLLDEPFCGLDSRETDMVTELITELNRSGVTVVMATNDADILAEHARRVIVLERGRVVKDDSAKAVFTDYFELLRHDVPMPAVRLTAQRLREHDVNMPGNIIHYDQFIDRLKIIMWRKEK